MDIVDANVLTAYGVPKWLQINFYSVYSVLTLALPEKK